MNYMKNVYDTYLNEIIYRDFEVKLEVTSNHNSGSTGPGQAENADDTKSSDHLNVGERHRL